MVYSSLHTSTLTAAWRFTLIGTVASLPIAVVVNWLPNSEASIGGAFMTVGALIAGGMAATRSTDPGAAGFRAGLLGGIISMFMFVATVFGTVLNGGTLVWPSLVEIGFVIIASGLVLGLTPVFGLVSGRIGGWAVNKVVARVPARRDKTPVT